MSSVLRVVVCLVFFSAATIWANGLALQFDGTDDFATVLDASSLDITMAITVEAWVKLTTAPSRHMHFVSKNEGYGSGDHAFALQTNGYLQPYLFMGQICFGGEVPSPLSADTWIHIAGTFDGEFRRFYVDGVLVTEASCDAGSQLTTNNLPLLLGKLNNFTQYFHGVMDEVRVWKIARNQAEIQSTMNRELTFRQTVDSNLVAYWRFRGESGQKVIDYSLYANDGVLGTNTTNQTIDPTWIMSDSPVAPHPKDTILVLEKVQAGIDVFLPMLSFIDVHVDLNPSSFDFNDYPLVIIAGNSASPAIQSALRNYLQNGGKVVIFGGAPYYLAGSTDLSSISDIIGTNQYGNIYDGHVTVADGSPFGMPYAAGEELVYTGPAGGGMAEVRNPTAALRHRVLWSDGSLFSYLHQSYNGEVFYFADFGGAWSQKTQRLFASGIDWLLRPQNLYMQMTLSSDTLYVFEQFLLPGSGQDLELCVGPFPEHVLPLLNTEITARVNGLVTPNSISVISDTFNLSGQGLRIVVNRADLVRTFGTPFDTTVETISLAGEVSPDWTYSAVSQILLIGHRSGDIDMDGSVNAADLAVLVSMFFGDVICADISKLDINHDARANVSDVLALIRFVFPS